MPTKIPTIRLNGRQATPASVSFTVPASAADLVPRPVMEIRAKAAELQRRWGDAESELGRAEDAIPEAEKADAKALGEALLADQPDPGPVHLTEARARLADAQRQVAGIKSALTAAQHEYYKTAVETDFTEAVEAIEALAADIVAPVDKMLGDAMLAITEYRSLRTLARQLAVFPAIPEGISVDMSGVHRLLGLTREAIERIGRDAEHIHYRDDNVAPPAA